ncbi:hypothetical protein [Brevibacterium litoralis]|uniref:hypothetical protein n=1 Tax=Brevibacterium litoralis TaxID=3138935 RepID=UPI0032EE9F9C
MRPVITDPRRRGALRVPDTRAVPRVEAPDLRRVVPLDLPRVAAPRPGFRVEDPRADPLGERRVEPLAVEVVRREVTAPV